MKAPLLKDRFGAFAFKKVWLTAVLLLTVTIAKAQTNQEVRKIHYQFEVAGITTPAAAKEMTDVIRPVFNTAEKPFGYFPWYDQLHQRFDFESEVAVSQDELKNMLSANGLVLTAFSSTQQLSTETEKQ